MCVCVNLKIITCLCICAVSTGEQHKSYRCSGQFVFLFMWRNARLPTAAEKKDLRTYANSKDLDQPVHPCSVVRILTVHLHNTGRYRANSKNLALMCVCANWPRGYKTFFMLNSAEHEIFSANKYENANNSWHFHIY